jgi:hypothetical protein
MKTITHIFFFFLMLSLGLSLQAQEVAVSYEIEKNGTDKSSLVVYMQSLTDQDVSIKAVNFSLALPEGCVFVTGQQAIFSSVWTDFLQESSLTTGLDLNYNNWNYNHRWQYGNADPGLPETTPLIVPANSKERLYVMEIQLEGSCADRVYLEQQGENRLNQMGDNDVLPIGWTVVHPRTELEIAEGLSLTVFPNPTRNAVTVTWNGPREVDYSFQLYNALGQLAQEGMILQSDPNEQIVDLSAYAQGTYYLKLAAQQKVYQVKLIKL